MEVLAGLLSLVGLSLAGLVFVLFFLLLAVGFMVVFVIILKTGNDSAQQQDAAREAFFVSMQEAHGGELIDSPYSAHPALCFPMGSATAHLVHNYIAGKNNRTYTDMVLLLPEELPPFALFFQYVNLGLGEALGMQDVEIGQPDFDRDFVIKGAPDVLGALLDEPVRSGVRALQQTLLTLESLQITANPHSDGGTILVIRRGERYDRFDMNDHIQNTRQLLEALQQSTQQLWAATAAQHRLALTTVDGRPQMCGQLNGVPVLVRVQRQGKGHQTHITISNTGPAGLHVLHVDHEGPDTPAIQTGNPVLDMAVTVRGDDAAGIMQLLGNANCTDALLPIVHGYPGTAVTDHGTELTIPGWQVEALPTIMEKVAAFTECMPGTTASSTGA